MKIESIKLNNFKCWYNLELKDLQKYNIIIGENNLGKSTFLESIEYIAGTNNFNQEKQGSLAGFSKFITREETATKIQFTFNISDNRLSQLLQDQLKNSGIFNFENECEFLKKELEFYRKEYNIISDFLNKKVRLISTVSLRNRSFENFLSEISQKYIQGKKINISAHNLRLIFDVLISNSIIYIPSRRRIDTESLTNPYFEKRTRNGSNIKKQLLNLKLSSKPKEEERYHKFIRIISNISFSPGIPNITGIDIGRNAPMIIVKHIAPTAINPIRFVFFFFL